MPRLEVGVMFYSSSTNTVPCSTPAGEEVRYSRVGSYWVEPISM